MKYCYKIDYKNSSWSLTKYVNADNMILALIEFDKEINISCVTSCEKIGDSL
jgi:hypothetical protein